MIDPELDNDLHKIEAELSHMDKATTGTWQTLWRGLIYGAGYVVGAVIIVVVIGWILNIVGIIPAFSNQVTQFRNALEHLGGTTGK